LSGTQHKEMKNMINEDSTPTICDECDMPLVISERPTRRNETAETEVECIWRELYGRMIEDTDIELAIESGQFKSLEDVRLAVKGRAQSINKALRECGFLKLPQHTIDYSSGEAEAVSLN